MDFWIDFVVSIRFQTFLIKFVLFLIDFRWLNQIQIRLNPDWIESRSKDGQIHQKQINLIENDKLHQLFDRFHAVSIRFQTFFFDQLGGGCRGLVVPYRIAAREVRGSNLDKVGISFVLAELIQKDEIERAQSEWMDGWARAKIAHARAHSQRSRSTMRVR